MDHLRHLPRPASPSSGKGLNGYRKRRQSFELDRKAESIGRSCLPLIARVLLHPCYALPVRRRPTIEYAVSDGWMSGDGSEGPPEPSLLTVRETALILRVCTATVYASIERGELPHVRIGNSIRILVNPHRVSESVSLSR